MTPRTRKAKPKGGKSRPSGNEPGSGKRADGWEEAIEDLNRVIARDSLASDVSGARTAANIAAAAAFFLYANAIVVCQFPYDDFSVRINPDVLDAKGDGTMSPFPEFWRNDFWGTPLSFNYSHLSYRPLVVQSFRWDASISSGAWMFHLSNGLLYAACAWLVVDVLLRPAARAGAGASDDAQRKALLLSGLWFAAHPVHVESVAGIVGRAEILSAIFCMLGARFGEKRILLGSVACFAAACLCKETAVVVPVMIGVVDILSAVIAPKKQLSKSSGGKTKENGWWRRAIVYFSAPFGYLRFRSWLLPSRGLRGKVMLHDSFIQHMHPLDKFRTALFIMAKYVQLMVWPGALSCDYGLGIIDPVTSWFSVEMAFVVFAAGLALAWGFYGLFRLHRTGDASPLLAVGWAFAPLVPASHIVDIGTVMAERLAFTPTVGVAMLICHFSGLAAAAKPKVWRNMQAVLFAICLWFGIRTLNRIPDWEDSRTLFLADVKSHPRGVKLLGAAARQLYYDDPAVAFEYAKRAQEVTDEYSGIFKRTRYATGLEIMASLKLPISGWKEGKNATEALDYANRILQIMEEEGKEDEETTRRALITRGTALNRLAIPGNDDYQSLIEEAIKTFEMAENFDKSRRSGRGLYCEFAMCLQQVNRNLEAYEKYRTCHEKSTAEGELMPDDYHNYAHLMVELSGVRQMKTDREAALESTKIWGNRAIQGIERYMASNKFDESTAPVWNMFVKDIKLLQSEL